MSAADPKAVHRGELAERRPYLPLHRMPAERLVKFAWEMSDIISAETLQPGYDHANEPSWVGYVRRLEKQAFAIVRDKANGGGRG